MNSKKFRTFLCIALSLVMLLPCFTVASFAADVTVVKNPTKTTFYQGIDWAYNKSGVVSVIGGSFDISGTVLSYLYNMAVIRFSCFCTSRSSALAFPD